MPKGKNPEERAGGALRQESGAVAAVSVWHGVVYVRDGDTFAWAGRGARGMRGRGIVLLIGFMYADRGD